MKIGLFIKKISPKFLSVVFLLAFTELYSGKIDFKTLDISTGWELKFSDSCTGEWKNYWFLDGLTATVTNTEKGMVFKAGTKEKNDSSHSVLWTKDIFNGDIKIEFEYTRLDSENRFVNILYLYARGTGEVPYNEDITEWNCLRNISSMRTYYNHMCLLHISFAAFDNSGKDSIDYIRIRHYPVENEKNFSTVTAIPPLIENTQLFKTGISYHITVIKSEYSLYFMVEGDDMKKLYFWDLTDNEITDKGRVGLRHMCMRSALYKNIRIYTKKLVIE